VRFPVKLALISIAVFLAAFQIRFSIETMEAQDTFLFIPFQLKPGTNTIEPGSFAQARDAVRPGDILLEVNDRSFTGISIYRQELRTVRRHLDSARGLSMDEQIKTVSPWRFHVTVRRPNGNIRTANVYFANCTCGSLGQSRVIWYLIVPPLLCLLAGLIVAALRPAAPVHWLFLAVAICLAQVALVPSVFNDRWSQEANPLEWQDWFRIPALAYQTFFSNSWPAWLLLFGVYSRPPEHGTKLFWWAATPTLAIAVLKTIDAIGWSENYQITAELHRQLEVMSTPATALALLALACVTWSLGTVRRVGALLSAVVALYFLYWPLSPVLAPFTPTYPYNAGFEAEIPHLFWTPEVVAAVFTVVVFLLVAARGRTRRKISEATCLAMLAIPFLYFASSKVWGVFWVESLPQATMGALYLGLLGSACLVIFKPHPPPASTPR
jgi:hypothetical protein